MVLNCSNFSPVKTFEKRHRKTKFRDGRIPLDCFRFKSVERPSHGAAFPKNNSFTVISDARVKSCDFFFFYLPSFFPPTSDMLTGKKKKKKFHRKRLKSALARNEIPGSPDSSCLAILLRCTLFIRFRSSDRCTTMPPRILHRM